MAASFHSVVDLKLDNNRVIYVTEPNNNTIRKIDPNGIVTTFAGSSSAGFVNGTGVTAKFDYPWDITFDAHSNLYVADALNLVIRKITPAGVVSTYAGNGLRGDVDGPALNASIDYVHTLVCGKDGTLYFVSNNKVKKITNEPYCISPSLPSGLSFDRMTGVISGTAIALLSPTKFSITATNEFGSSTFDIIISVNDILPSLTYPLQNLVVKGEEIAPIVPTNSGGEVISYSIGPSLPLGLVFNTKTGVISGTPTVVQADSTYTIIAHNTGGRVSFDLSLTVIDSFKMDTDKDGVSSGVFDNCPFKFNPNQLDSNKNKIGDECETNSLVVSKIISPNDDGVNDTWMIYNIEKYPGLSISVFNRFGQQVYHSDDYTNDWNANELQESTYFYTIFSSFEDKKIELKGWFYIVK